MKPWRFLEWSDDDGLAKKAYKGVLIALLMLLAAYGCLAGCLLSMIALYPRHHRLGAAGAIGFFVIQMAMAALPGDVVV